MPREEEDCVVSVHTSAPQDSSEFESHVLVGGYEGIVGAVVAAAVAAIEAHTETRRATSEESEDDSQVSEASYFVKVYVFVVDDVSLYERWTPGRLHCLNHGLAAMKNQCLSWIDHGGSFLHFVLTFYFQSSHWQNNLSWISFYFALELDVNYNLPPQRTLVCF